MSQVLHRPPHVHDHLPPMYPELEEEAGATAAADVTPDAEDSKGATVLGTPTGQGGRSVKKEPTSGVGGEAGGARETDGCPLRELSSVMMTSSGFLSPCREGKLPESRTPHGAIDPADREERKMAGQAVKRHLDGVEKIQIKQEIIDPEEEEQLKKAVGN